MSKQNVLHSPRLLELRRHRRRILLWKIFSFFAGLLFIFAGLSYLSRLKQLNINEIRITGNKVADRDEIEKIVREEISGYFLWIFPKTNVFLYPKGAIKGELRDRYKIFKVVNLSIAPNQVLKVDVFEREGLYTWCGAELPKVINQKEEECYFLDENGFIFGEAPFFSGEVYLKFYGPTDGKGDAIGSSILTGNFEKLILFKDTLLNMGLKPAVMYTNDNKEIRIYLQRGKVALLGPEIIFNADADLESLAVNLETALSTDPLMTNFKNNYSSLEYIDLRFGNKVYYRFR